MRCDQRHNTTFYRVQKAGAFDNAKAKCTLVALSGQHGLARKPLIGDPVSTI